MCVQALALFSMGDMTHSITTLSLKVLTTTTFIKPSVALECRGKGQGAKAVVHMTEAGNTKGGSITVLLTSCFTGLD